MILTDNSPAAEVLPDGVAGALKTDHTLGLSKTQAPRRLAEFDENALPKAHVRKPVTGQPVLARTAPTIAESAPRPIGRVQSNSVEKPRQRIPQR